jgi:hypothetical protein
MDYMCYIPEDGNIQLHAEFGLTLAKLVTFAQPAGTLIDTKVIVCGRMELEF